MAHCARWFTTPLGAPLRALARGVSSSGAVRRAVASQGGYHNRVLPKRILLVRHGESLGNVDAATYVHVADARIPLSEKGHMDATKTGRAIQRIAGDGPYYFYTSPYLRTKQTLAGIIGELGESEVLAVKEEPRVTEQQFGNFQNLLGVKQAKEERARFGRFYYRFTNGESGLDVYNRATAFISTLWRDMQKIPSDDVTVVVVTHGLTMRLILMRWFGYTVREFEATTNAPNGAIVVMERQEDGGGNSWLELTEASARLVGVKTELWEASGSLYRLLDDLPDPRAAILETRALVEQSRSRLARDIVERSECKETVANGWAEAHANIERGRVEAKWAEAEARRRDRNWSVTGTAADDGRGGGGDGDGATGSHHQYRSRRVKLRKSLDWDY